jgi:hypothetical protein
MRKKREYLVSAMAVAAVGIYAVGDLLIDLPPEALEFRSEVVRAAPEGDHVRFTGEYTFFSPHRARRSYKLAFPMVERGRLDDAQEVRVLANGRELRFRRLRQGIEFRLPVQPREATSVTISYVMPAPHREAVYITRTANLWPKPLESACFVIPNGIESNYHSDGQTEARFANFRPEQNWRVQWSD